MGVFAPSPKAADGRMLAFGKIVAAKPKHIVPEPPSMRTSIFGRAKDKGELVLKRKGSKQRHDLSAIGSGVFGSATDGGAVMRGYKKRLSSQQP